MRLGFAFCDNHTRLPLFTRTIRSSTGGIKVGIGLGGISCGVLFSVNGGNRCSLLVSGVLARRTKSPRFFVGMCFHAGGSKGAPRGTSKCDGPRCSTLDRGLSNRFSPTGQESVVVRVRGVVVGSTNAIMLKCPGAGLIDDGGVTGTGVCPYSCC